MGDILSINIPPLNPPQGSTCPYVYASNVFTEEQLDSIEELGEDVVEYNESYRKSLVTTIPDNPNTGWMFNLLSRVVHQLNCEYYRFNLSVFKILSSKNFIDCPLLIINDDFSEIIDSISYLYFSITGKTNFLYSSIFIHNCFTLFLIFLALLK